MDTRILPFRWVWLVHFVSWSTPGESPRPLCLAAIELRSGTLLDLRGDDLMGTRWAPMDVTPESVYITYDAPVALGCHLSLGWELPVRVIDLYAELRAFANGAWRPQGRSITEGLACLGVPHLDLVADLAMLRYARERQPERLLIEGLAQRLCARAVEALQALLELADWDIPIEVALWRGEYARAVTIIERRGTSIDLPMLARLRQIQAGRGGCRECGSGSLDIAGLRRLAVGGDGRNRVSLAAFGAKTGRNAPSSSAWIFGHPAWARGLIRPGPGMAVAYVDWSFQEYGIAAALASDEAMMEAYRSGDPYLAFAQHAGLAPAGATRDSHPELRATCKTATLALQYGVGTESLGHRTGQSVTQARDLVVRHRQSYRRFWRWSEELEVWAANFPVLRTNGGWPLRFEWGCPRPEFRRATSLLIQASGAEMLQLAACLLLEQGIRICTLVHDAILIEAPLGEIDEAVAATQNLMAEASSQVLAGFRLETEAVIYRFPERFMDPRGQTVWSHLMRRVEGGCHG